MSSSSATVRLRLRGLSVRYGGRAALSGATLNVRATGIMGLVGPSGAGKSTLLRTIHRADATDPKMEVSGSIELDGKSLRARRDVYALRRSIGYVPAVPTAFPMSIRDNVAFAANLAGVTSGIDDVVEESLRKAVLWDPVKDRLQRSALELSVGERQRLAIARSLAMSPSILLLDEPFAMLDPVTTIQMEEELRDLKSGMAIVLATPDAQLARRVADRLAVLLDGSIVDAGKTKKMFAGDATHPAALQYLEARHG